MPAQRPQRSGKSATTGHIQHKDYSGSGNALADFIQWCEDNGVIAPALILCQWVRTNAPHKSYSDKSLAVMRKNDCIHVQVWTTGEKFTFFDNWHSTPAQRWAEIKQRQRLKQQAEELQRATYAKAARQAAQLWDEATQAPIAGYFASKRLNFTHGARWHERLQCWLILVTDIDGTIYTIQKVFNKPTPNKFYLKGGRTAGGMVVIGLSIPANRVIVCEGFATGCTLREETGETVVCALTAGNLLAVCRAIRGAYRDINIIVCGDDDRATNVNVGRQKADAAAASVNGKVVFPTFSDNCDDCTDWNDAVNCELCGVLS